MGELAVAGITVDLKNALACGLHRQGLLLTGKLALRARTRLLAQGPLQIAFDEAIAIRLAAIALLRPLAG